MTKLPDPIKPGSDSRRNWKTINAGLGVMSGLAMASRAHGATLAELARRPSMSPGPRAPFTVYTDDGWQTLKIAPGYITLATTAPGAGQIIRPSGTTADDRDGAYVALDLSGLQTGTYAVSLAFDIPPVASEFEGSWRVPGFVARNYLVADDVWSFYSSQQLAYELVVGFEIEFADFYYDQAAPARNSRINGQNLSGHQYQILDATNMAISATSANMPMKLRGPWSALDDYYPGDVVTLESGGWHYVFVCWPIIDPSFAADTAWRYYNGCFKATVSGVAATPSPASPTPTITNPWKLLSKHQT